MLSTDGRHSAVPSNPTARAVTTSRRGASGQRIERPDAARPDRPAGLAVPRQRRAEHRRGGGGGIVCHPGTIIVMRAPRSSGGSGMVTPMRQPVGASMTSIAPPCNSTAHRAIARPRPVPPAEVAPRLKRWNTRSRSAAGMPGPSSHTSSRSPDGSAAPPEHRHPATRRAVPNRVVHQVDHHLPQPRRVGDGDQVGRRDPHRRRRRRVARGRRARRPRAGTRRRGTG